MVVTKYMWVTPRNPKLAMHSSRSHQEGDPHVWWPGCNRLYCADYIGEGKKGKKSAYYKHFSNFICFIYLLVVWGSPRKYTANKLTTGSVDLCLSMTCLRILVQIQTVYYYVTKQQGQLCQPIVSSSAAVTLPYQQTRPRKSASPCVCTVCDCDRP